MARDGKETGRAIGGEHELPLEHTARVRAQATEDVSDPAQRARGGSDRALKARRRARDAQAERRAVLAVLALFLGFGGFAFVALNLSGGVGGSGEGSGSGASSSGAPSSAGAGAQTSAGAGRSGSGRSGPSLAKAREDERPRRAKGPARQSTTTLDETPELPALRLLEKTGLTAGAEGIPKVETDAPGDVAAAAGLEACRFAYGVWEFSPNQTFRFISTCRGLGRLELVGAYEVREARVHLSALASGRTRWTSVFEVETPSTMKSSVVSESSGRPIQMDVTQRITVVRGGLHGDDFRDGFKRKNRLSVPAEPSESATPSPEAPARPKSALEELLGG